MQERTPSQRLAELGLSLPPPPIPKGAYVPVVIVGNLAWVSGMLPLQDDKLLSMGLVDRDVEISDAKAAARVATLNALSALSRAAGGLDRVERVVRVGVFVASSEGFVSQPAVANGASELLLEIFGENGKHARAAVGVARLPLDTPVEVEMVAQIKEGDVRPPPEVRSG